MSNNNSTQKTREKIKIADIDSFEDLWMGSDEWVNIEDKVVGEYRHGTMKRILAKRLSDDKYFALEYKSHPSDSIVDSNRFPLEAVEVFPKQITTTVYE